MNLNRLLLLGLLAGNVLLRFFTNEINVLPRVLNIWDVMVTFALTGLALTTRRTLPPLVDRGKIVRCLVWFNMICILGSILNSDHIYSMAMLSQMIMWNEPVLLFLAVLHLPFTLTDIDKFRRLLIFLIGLEVVIGLLQVPIFLKTGESEAIHGTFTGNAEQYQFFIILGMFWLAAQLEVLQSGQTWRKFFIPGILTLVLLIDNKASWIALALTLAIVIPKLPGPRGHISGKFKTYAKLGALLLLGYYTVKSASGTAANKFGNVAAALESGNLLNIGKIKALRDVTKAYRRYPHMTLTGSGLGTFYGRASFQYFPFHILETMENSPVAGYSESTLAAAGGASASMSGVIDQAVGITAFYKQFFDYEKIFSVGSGTADFPTSSYISLMGETGLIGTFLYISFYLVGLRKARATLRDCAQDANFFPFAAATYGSLIYLMFMGGYNFWLDCGRVNTIVWTMLALSTRYVALQRRERERKNALASSDLAPSFGEPIPQSYFAKRW